MDKNTVTDTESIDWLNKFRLRLLFLPKNPFFAPAVVRSRERLNIPKCGLDADIGLGKWLIDHLGGSVLRLRYSQPRQTTGPAIPLAWNDYPAEHAARDAVSWFKEGVIPWRERDSVERLKIWIEAGRLVSDFDLPPSSRLYVIWHILTGDPVPPRMETIFADQFELMSSSEQWDNAIDQEINEWVLDGFPEGIDGTVVVIRLLVNDYTTKKDFIAQAWGKVQQIRDDNYPKRPSRRRSVSETSQEYEDWLPGYVAHHFEGKSLDEVASDEEIEEVETVRYRFDQLDELFVRPKV